MVLLADRVLEETIARGLARGCELVGFARDPPVALLPAAVVVFPLKLNPVKFEVPE